MLAVVRELQHEMEFVAIAAPVGPLADSLDEMGIERTPFTPRKHGRLRRSQEEIFQQIASALESIQPDLLHANSLAMARLTGKWVNELTIPCTGHLRDIIKLSNSAISDLNSNNGLVAVSSATKHFHVEQGLDSSKTHVIYNGVDLEKFRPRPSQKKLHAEYGIPEDTLLALTVGQICLRKGHDVLAAAAVQAMSNVPHLHLLVAGERYSSKPESIDFEQNFQQTFTDAGFRSRLHRLGYRNDISSLMNEVEFLIHAAKQEPLGRVLLEAVASGLPIIATDVGGTSEIIPTESGTPLVPSGDADRLSQQIVQLSASSEERSHHNMSCENGQLKNST